MLLGRIPTAKFAREPVFLQAFDDELCHVGYLSDVIICQASTSLNSSEFAKWRPLQDSGVIRQISGVMKNRFYKLNDVVNTSQLTMMISWWSWSDVESQTVGGLQNCVVWNYNTAHHIVPRRLSCH